MATNKSTNCCAPGDIKAPAPTVNTSKGAASKCDCARPEHRSPEAMLSHVRKTCSGGKAGAGKC
jgi:hypothetical protein